MKITLTEEEAQLAIKLGEATYQKFKDAQGHYTNYRSSHIRGKVGEIGVNKWLISQGIKTEPLYLDEDEVERCDIVAGKTRIDVKTWAEHNWENLGRCVSVNQLPYLERKADMIIWATTEGKEVTIRGCSFIEDIRLFKKKKTGTIGKRQIYNYQAAEKQLRTINGLLWTLEWNA